MGDLALRRRFFEGRWLVPFVVGWLLAVPLTLVVARLWVPSDGLPVVEASGSLTSEGLRVSPPFAVDGVVDGDVVVSVDGRLMTEAFAAPGTSRLRAGQPHAYVVRRASTERTLTVVLRSHRDVASLLTQSWAFLVVTAAIFVGSIWLARRRPGVLAAEALLLAGASLLSLGISTLGYLEPIDLVARPWLVVWSLLSIAGFGEFAVALVMFAMGFPDRGVAQSRRTRTIERTMTVLPITVVVGLAGCYAVGGASAGLFAVVDAGFGLWWIACVLTAMVMLVVTLWRLRHNLVVRRQCQIVLVGVVASIVPWLIVNIVPNDISGAWISLLIIPLPISIAAAISRHQLFELEIILSRSLVVAATAAVLFGVYAGMVAITAAIVGSESSILVSVPAAGVVAVLLAPVREGTRRTVARRLLGNSDDPAAVFAHLGARLTNATDPGDLLTATVDTVYESLRVPYSAIEMNVGGTLVVVCRRGTDGGATESFVLRDGGDEIGRLVVAPRRGDTALSGADRSLLGSLARHTAIAARLSLTTVELREAQRGLLIAREAERQRIQRDLHDRIAPMLVGLGLRLSVAADEQPNGPVGSLVEACRQEVSTSLDEIRRLVHDLGPAEVEQIGLAPAIAAAAARLGSREDFQFDVEIPLSLPPISRVAEDTLYVVAMEAMTNALRHSGGSRVKVSLAPTAGHTMELVVDDDGRGMRPDSIAGLGIASMRSRAESVGGTLGLNTTPEGGTRLVCSIPMTGE